MATNAEAQQTTVHDAARRPPSGDPGAAAGRVVEGATVSRGADILAV
jgi:hypothetical protein